MNSTRRQNEVLAKVIYPDTINMNAKRRMYTDASVRRLIVAADNAIEAGFSMRKFCTSIGVLPSQFSQWRVRLGTEPPGAEKPEAHLSERTVAEITGMKYRVDHAPVKSNGTRMFPTDLKRDMVALFLTAKSERPDYSQMVYAESLGVQPPIFSRWLSGLGLGEAGFVAHEPAPEPEQLTIPDPHFEAMNGNGAEVVLSNFPTQALAPVRKPQARRRMAVTCVIKIECPNVLAAVEQLQNLPLEGRVEISILPDIER